MKRIFATLALFSAFLAAPLTSEAQVHVRAPGVRVNVGGGFGGFGGFNRGFSHGGFHGGFNSFNSFNSFHGFNRGFGFSNVGFRNFGHFNSFGAHHAFAFNSFAVAAPFFSQTVVAAPVFASGCGCYGANVIQQAPVVVQAPPVVIQQAPVVLQAPVCDVGCAAAAIIPSCGIGHFANVGVFASRNFGHHFSNRSFFGGGGHGRQVIRSRTVVRTR